MNKKQKAKRAIEARKITNDSIMKINVETMRNSPHGHMTLGELIDAGETGKRIRKSMKK